jgi:AraC family transcriptional regulator of adaptative response / DNA-3-methyladenine glycosylase II
MVLDADACYGALAARDARFDGSFFVGVSTTGIYCRPVCPARTPRRDRCAFFANAAAAEAGGYRPCLRCRPETAPGASNVDAIKTSAVAILRRIEDGALVEGGLEDLAAEFGITGRHLRRVVNLQFGVSPAELARTQRLLTAKRLLTDTALPMGEVALASGFASLRRFNACFKDRYGLTPSEVRKSRRGGAMDAGPTCLVHYRPPFDWDSLLGFLAARAVEGVEAVVDGAYLRTVAIRGRRGWVAVTASPERSALRVSTSHELASVLPQVLARVRRLFDLSADPEQISGRLSPLGDAHPGLRVPGAFDGFETAVRAVLGQQVSVAGAAVTAAKLARAFGEPFETPHPQLSRLWPPAESLAELDPSDIAAVGVIRSRAAAIVELARAVVARKIRLAPGADVEKTIEALFAVPGIGPWTAQYIAMRCLSWPDVFLDTDLAVKKALRAMPAANPDDWRPWRSYAVMHLWKSLEVTS